MMRSLLFSLVCVCLISSVIAKSTCTDLQGECVTPTTCDTATSHLVTGKCGVGKKCCVPGADPCIAAGGTCKLRAMCKKQTHHLVFNLCGPGTSCCIPGPPAPPTSSADPSGPTLAPLSADDLARMNAMFGPKPAACLFSCRNWRECRQAGGTERQGACNGIGMVCCMDKLNYSMFGLGGRLIETQTDAELEQQHQLHHQQKHTHAQVLQP